MNLSAPFVRRPIGTILMTLGLALAGFSAYFQLPVSPLPQVDFPTIGVSASLPGASPDTMAASVATPLERRLGRIADVTEMTSSSSTGSTHVTLQFGLDRQIDGAARDVQAAISASRADLPATLRSNPTYSKANPSDAPVIILALTSQTRTPAQIYDAAATIMQQSISQVKGVGEVEIGGGSLPAVRVELNPYALANYGIGLEDVRAAIASANANRPKGVIETGDRRLQIYTNDNATHAADYASLVIAWRNNSPIRLSDVGTVGDGVEDIHTLGLYNGKPSIVVLVTRQPGANIINTVDAIKAKLPILKASIPQDIDISVANDRTRTIRASISDVEMTLLLAIVLVVAVTAFFLKSGRAALIPAVAVTVSILGTIGVMFLAGFSLDNLSLMALTIATGFVVDDAIVVLENTTRHLEQGMTRMEAALRGAREVGFTVLSMSISLVAVFIPILMMGGIVGLLFREFAITLASAILVSLLLSLTTTPMMCALLLKREDPGKKPGWLARSSDWIIGGMQRGYTRVLDWALDYRPVVLAIFLACIVATAYLFITVPKGFFPEQDTGQVGGMMRADQSSSFQIARSRLVKFVDILQKDPAVDSVVGFTGGAGRGGGGGGFLQISLKPKSVRKESAEEFIAGIRRKTADITGATLFLNPVQDVRVGARSGNGSYQYTLTGDDRDQLREWAAKLTESMKAQPALADVNSDQTDHGLESYVTINRDAAARYGITPRDVDNALYDSFGQRQATTIFNAQNQYHVVMELDPAYTKDPGALSDVHVPATGAAATAAERNPVSGLAAAGSTVTPTLAPAQIAAMPAIPQPPAIDPSPTQPNPTGGSSGASAAGLAAANPLANAAASINPTTGASSGSPGNATAAPPARGASQGLAVSTSTHPMIPLSDIAHWADSSQPRAVNHQDLGVATTISFSLNEGFSLSDATTAIAQASADIGMPITLHGGFRGTAQAYQQSLGSQPWLILSAVAVIYVVLGILYESTIHPLTVLSTLPSAGLGAVIALILFHIEFSIIALIGVFLLIGIVKKNAILIIDFALEAERSRGLSPREAIREASLIRFRPIMMTTLAAILAAVPLAIGWGDGAELRRPLGIAIVSGLIVSQALTLFTTPVVYLALDRFRRRSADEKRLGKFGDSKKPAPQPAE